MLAKLLQLVALAGVASTVLAEAHTAPSLALKDIGNGVHGESLSHATVSQCGRVGPGETWRALRLAEN